MKVVVFTLGCKVNQYESDVMLAALLKAGYEVSDKLTTADVYILNTCAVTKEAERKSRQLIARARRFSPDAEIYVCGCASEKQKEQFDGLGINGIFGTKDKFDVLKKLGAVPSSISTSRRQAYINIQDGCDNFCSYCVIPYLRGDSRSRTIEEIVVDANNAEKSGKQIIITGINIAKFGKDIGTDLTQLMYALKDIKTSISIGSFYVEGIDERLLQSFTELYDFVPHFHLSLQTGDDGVLRDMGRKYTTAEYLAKVKLIRKYFANAILTTDIIVGYPTETDESHRNTLDFVQEVGFSDIHIFVFSKREGTKAYSLPDLPSETVGKRKRELNALKIKLSKGV